jgi:hypothetical protein
MEFGRREWSTGSSQWMRIESRAVEKGDRVRRDGEGDQVSVPSQWTWNGKQIRRNGAVGVSRPSQIIKGLVAMEEPTQVWIMFVAKERWR